MARDLDNDVGGAAGALGHDPELEELQRRHRGFVFPATVFALVFYMALIFAAAYAHGFMATKVWGEINVGYLFALSQFVMTFVLAWLYTRFARRTFDPMAADLLRKLHASQRDAAAESGEARR